MLHLARSIDSGSLGIASLAAFMSHPVSFHFALSPLPDNEQKRAASLFAALAELVGTYGEDAVAKYVEGLPTRVRRGEFSVALAKQ
jgi:hypothetical protein